MLLGFVKVVTASDSIGWLGYLLVVIVAAGSAGYRYYVSMITP